MFDLEAHLAREIRAAAGPRPTFIFPEAYDPRVLAAASRLLKVANVVLLVRPETVVEVVERSQVALEGNLERLLLRSRCLLPEDDPELLDEFTEALYVLGRGKRWELTREEAASRVRDPVYFAVLAVRQGYADAVIGGVSLTSRDFFQPCLRLLPKRKTVYEMALFALPDRHDLGIYRENLVAFADVAVNPLPSPEALADIAVGAGQIMRDLIPERVLPVINGAIISYSTKGSGGGPSVELIREAERLIPERLAELVAKDPRYATIRIEAELQISVAISETAAREKLKERFALHPGAGRANLLIVPNLDVGNLLFHIYATRFPEARRCLIMGGLMSQAVDLSRNASVPDIVHASLALALRLQRSKGFQRTPQDRFFKRFQILAVNPGRGQTNVVFWDGVLPKAELVVQHAPLAGEQEGSLAITAQAEARLEEIRAELQARGLVLDGLDAVVGRGGLLRPLEGGTYPVDAAMLEDLRRQVGGEHPSNLGGLLADALARAAGCKAYVVDPVVVDELDPAFRLTGLKGHLREPAWHALAQKAVAKRYADEHGREYRDLRLIVAHLGQGISIGAHVGGRVVAVNHALYEGPMAPERAGGLPSSVVLELARTVPDERECRELLVSRGGLRSHLGGASLAEAEARAAAGDEQARLTLQALLRGIAAEICSRLPWLGGALPDRVLLTGELTRSSLLVAHLTGLLEPLGLKVKVYPGDQEMAALRDGALRVLKGVEKPRCYADVVSRYERAGQDHEPPEATGRPIAITARPA